MYSLLESNDYIAVLPYVYASPEVDKAMAALRNKIMSKTKRAVLFGYGPRYLHSTGQLQKGGPNKGVFLIVSADELKDIPIVDGKAPSLGTLAKAQAAGDRAILSERGRRCLHLHLPDNTGVTLRCLANIISQL